MLVTDAMPSVGASDKRFQIGGQIIVAEDGRFANAEGRLAGSDLDMASAVRNTVRGLGLPLEEALCMASLYPVAFLGLERRLGRIAPGFDADLVLLDEDLEVRETWIGGQPGRDV
jgi:N-acetylglucosamine-6-phosphate deacetylase